eukprot:CAMPEP_0173086306 /NCGR_PEP_ID=MMETSP1102-20130122/22658_1 /TAXON_ID=49646 /ORGANISM="Geminigera sp., Strain Caron Lab Isolate" /LENGTH=140 /DNA_ID=CAMNT_0013966789 /DNA_START=207 /DNA_END=629 /DNA_ORIENTATION=-
MLPCFPWHWHSRHRVQPSNSRISSSKSIENATSESESSPGPDVARVILRGIILSPAFCVGALSVFKCASSRALLPAVRWCWEHWNRSGSTCPALSDRAPFDTVGGVSCPARVQTQACIIPLVCGVSGIFTCTREPVATPQ